VLRAVEAAHNWQVERVIGIRSTRLDASNLNIQIGALYR
jgi:hypothetical protein